MRSPSFGQYRQMLGRYLRPQRARVLVLAALLLTGIVLQLVSPQIARQFIDLVQAGAAQRAMLLAAGLYLAAALLRSLLLLASSYLGEAVGQSATNALRSDLARHVLSLDLTFHGAHTAGELIERVEGDVTALSQFFSELFLRVISNMLLLVGVLVVLMVEDWRLGLPFTAFALLVALVLGSMRDVATPHLRATRQAAAELLGFLEERLSGAEDIRANGAVAYSLRRLFEQMRKVFRADFTASIKIAQVRTTTIALFSMGALLALLLGAYLFRAGALTLGTVYLLYAYMQMLSRPVERLVLDAQDFQRASASLLRVVELYHTQSAISEPEHGRQLPGGPLSVEFRQVAFAYPAGSPVLSDVSLHLAPGRVLGLLGRTGSGKTTLTRLLLRLYEPASGEIILGGVPLGSVSSQSLRQRVGVVTQEVQLFHATVRDNLTLFDDDVPVERLEAVLDELGLGDWLRSLPDGLDTTLASGGDLSAGQAQLLALARVFLRDPGLVVLDEAASRVDPATEHLIERAITRLLAGRTAIIIAHRLATVERADQVLILADGRVAEQGARAGLAAEPGSLFARLLQRGLQEALA